MSSGEHKMPRGASETNEDPWSGFDNWKHRASNMRCETCMSFVFKNKTEAPAGTENKLGRCRRRAPTMAGWPVVFVTDWCGEHKLDENKI